ncbi:hypothetical protein BLNAU_8863 [Blattamonas nauphoetae]|uniref:FYVE-type domain-containing protein n=1 Tax=Blattamonas nauphoetae TaxID=2049346 RepID=A0ABQ9XX86_9EUKA|nr:hypothetical protein BLNAU_8863 [Blattamonas nauphoetae]
MQGITIQSPLITPLNSFIFHGPTGIERNRSSRCTLCDSKPLLLKAHSVCDVCGLSACNTCTVRYSPFPTESFTDCPSISSVCKCCHSLFEPNAYSTSESHELIKNRTSILLFCSNSHPSLQHVFLRFQDDLPALDSKLSLSDNPIIEGTSVFTPHVKMCMFDFLAHLSSVPSPTEKEKGDSSSISFAIRQIQQQESEMAQPAAFNHPVFLSPVPSFYAGFSYSPQDTADNDSIPSLNLQTQHFTFGSEKCICGGMLCLIFHTLSLLLSSLPKPDARLLEFDVSESVEIAAAHCLSSEEPQSLSLSHALLVFLHVLSCHCQLLSTISCFETIFEHATSLSVLLSTPLTHSIPTTFHTLSPSPFSDLVEQRNRKKFRNVGNEELSGQMSLSDALGSDLSLSSSTSLRCQTPFFPSDETPTIFISLTVKWRGKESDRLKERNKDTLRHVDLTQVIFLFFRNLHHLSHSAQDSSEHISDQISRHPLFTFVHSLLHSTSTVLLSAQLMHQHLRALTWADLLSSFPSLVSLNWDLEGMSDIVKSPILGVTNEKASFSSSLLSHAMNSAQSDEKSEGMAFIALQRVFSLLSVSFEMCVHFDSPGIVAHSSLSILSPFLSSVSLFISQLHSASGHRTNTFSMSDPSLVETTPSAPRTELPHVLPIHNSPPKNVSPPIFQSTQVASCEWLPSVPIISSGLFVSSPTVLISLLSSLLLSIRSSASSPTDTHTISFSSSLIRFISTVFSLDFAPITPHQADSSSPSSPEPKVVVVEPLSSNSAILPLFSVFSLPQIISPSLSVAPLDFIDFFSAFQQDRIPILQSQSALPVPTLNHPSPPPSASSFFFISQHQAQSTHNLPFMSPDPSTTSLHNLASSASHSSSSVALSATPYQTPIEDSVHRDMIDRSFERADVLLSGLFLRKGGLCSLFGERFWIPLLDVYRLSLTCLCEVFLQKACRPEMEKTMISEGRMILGGILRFMKLSEKKEEMERRGMRIDRSLMLKRKKEIIRRWTNKLLAEHDDIALSENDLGLRGVRQKDAWKDVGVELDLLTLLNTSPPLFDVSDLFENESEWGLFIEWAVLEKKRKEDVVLAVHTSSILLSILLLTPDTLSHIVFNEQLSHIDHLFETTLALADGIERGVSWMVEDEVDCLRFCLNPSLDSGRPKQGKKKNSSKLSRDGEHDESRRLLNASYAPGIQSFLSGVLKEEIVSLCEKCWGKKGEQEEEEQMQTDTNTSEMKTEEWREEEEPAQTDRTTLDLTQSVIYSVPQPTPPSSSVNVSVISSSPPSPPSPSTPISAATSTLFVLSPSPFEEEMKDGQNEDRRVFGHHIDLKSEDSDVESIIFDRNENSQKKRENIDEDENGFPREFMPLVLPLLFASRLLSLSLSPQSIQPLTPLLLSKSSLLRSSLLSPLLPFSLSAASLFFIALSTHQTSLPKLEKANLLEAAELWARTPIFVDTRKSNERVYHPSAQLDVKGELDVKDTEIYHHSRSIDSHPLLTVSLTNHHTPIPATKLLDVSNVPDSLETLLDSDLDSSSVVLETLPIKPLSFHPNHSQHHLANSPSPTASESSGSHSQIEHALTAVPQENSPSPPVTHPHSAPLASRALPSPQTSPNFSSFDDSPFLASMVSLADAHPASSAPMPFSCLSFLPSRFNHHTDYGALSLESILLCSSSRSSFSAGSMSFMFETCDCLNAALLCLFHRLVSHPASSRLLELMLKCVEVFIPFEEQTKRDRPKPDSVFDEMRQIVSDSLVPLLSSLKIPSTHLLSTLFQLLRTECGCRAFLNLRLPKTDATRTLLSAILSAHPRTVSSFNVPPASEITPFPILTLSPHHFNLLSL